MSHGYRRNFGTATAAKRGRNPALPYVPVIDYTEQTAGSFTRTHTEQILGRAYADRDEAVACAQRVIDNTIAAYAAKLTERGARSLREFEGLPREIERNLR